MYPAALLLPVSYPVIRFSISFANVMITPPARVRKPLARCDGSWDFSERPICTMPNPRSISPMARISANMNVDRLFITASGSLAAYARSAPTVKIITSSIYTTMVILISILSVSFSSFCFITSIRRRVFKNFCRLMNN